MCPSLSYIQQPLALATSQIHRSRSLEELQKTFLAVTPRFVNADAYGMYLFDDELKTKTISSHQANKKFLNEYEKIRAEDPLFKHLLHNKKFTHSLDVFDRKEWMQQPLHDFLSRWGLDYSIEAPLIHEGNILGTLNFAIGGRKYFGEESIASARFLCGEFDVAYKRILETQQLKDALQEVEMGGVELQKIPKRAQQVLELLVSGLKNHAISERLDISENTVRHHIKHIYKILGVHNRAQLTKRVLIENAKAGQKLN